MRAVRLVGLAEMALAAAALCVAVAAAAPNEICDPSLPSPKDDPHAYRLRGDRCEGRYVREVGGTTLLVASLVESFEVFDRTSARPLNVVWPIPPGATEVRVRAQGLKRRMYYRMDTRRPAGAGSYVWPSSLLAVMVQRRDDIGLLASTRLLIRGVERDVYLPVRVGYGQSPSRSERYELIVVPGVQLSELFVTLSELGPEGQVRQVIRKDEPLRYGYYPAERGISIEMAGLGRAGIYRVDLAARIESGGASTRELWFYHSGKR
jgi:hypothetical protein